MNFKGQLESDYDEDDGSQENETFGLDQTEQKELRDLTDASIFLVDAHQSMQKDNHHNDGESNYSQVLRATLSYIKSKIMAGKSDKIAVILFGLEKESHIEVVYGLDQPDAALVKTLESMVAEIQLCNEVNKTTEPKTQLVKEPSSLLEPDQNNSARYSLADAL